MYKQRFYLDGKLHKTSEKRDVETLRRWLNNLEAEWSANIGPLVEAGQFDPNNGHTITRVSPDELLVITTGNKKLRFVNIAVKG